MVKILICGSSLGLEVRITVLYWSMSSPSVSIQTVKDFIIQGMTEWDTNLIHALVILTWQRASVIYMYIPGKWKHKK